MEFNESAPLVKYIEKGMSGKQSNASATKMTSFLLEWLSLRRKGQDIMHTPVGYICQGRALDSGHSFFVTHPLQNGSAGKLCDGHANRNISGNEDVDGDAEEEEKEEDDDDE